MWAWHFMYSAHALHQLITAAHEMHGEQRRGKKYHTVMGSIMSHGLLAVRVGGYIQCKKLMLWGNFFFACFNFLALGSASTSHADG